MSPSHVVTPVSSLALHLSLSRTWLYSLTPLSLIVTCHYLSLPLRHTAISDYKMNLMLSAEALREEGAVWGGTDEEKKKLKQPFLNELQRAVTSERRGCSLLTLFPSLLANPLACIYTRYLTHSRHTSRLLFPASPSSLLSLNGFVSFPCC